VSLKTRLIKYYKSDDGFISVINTATCKVIVIRTWVSSYILVDFTPSQSISVI